MAWAALNGSRHQLEKAEAKGPLTDKAYLDALAKNHMLTREQGIGAAIAKYKLDALVAPSAGPTWLIDLIDGDHDTGGSSSLAAVAAYPSISVPAGYVFGLPMGISFFGTAWSEPALIRIAYAFEQATKVRKVPRSLATAPLGHPAGGHTAHGGHRLAAIAAVEAAARRPG
jgi:amidase